MTVMFLASLKGSCRSGFFCAGLGELFFSGIVFVVWDWATAVVARRTTQKSRSSFMTLPFCSNVDTFVDRLDGCDSADGPSLTDSAIPFRGKRIVGVRGLIARDR